jgi:hypothetical protein
MRSEARGRRSLSILDKELEVHLKDGLEQPHVGALVQADLMLPDVDEQDFAGSEGEEGALALEFLVLAALAAVGALDIHDENVVGHLDAVALGALVLGHPDTFGGLLALRLGHDGEVGTKEVVEECGLAGRLRTEDGDEVIIESSVGDLLLLEVLVEIGAAAQG